MIATLGNFKELEEAGVINGFDFKFIEWLFSQIGRGWCHDDWQGCALGEYYKEQTGYSLSWSEDAVRDLEVSRELTLAIGSTDLPENNEELIDHLYVELADV